MMPNNANTPSHSSKNLQSLVLGGGCFWCLEAVFKGINGVLAVESGYCNGFEHLSHFPPSYEDVCTGTTGYVEVIKITFNPQLIDIQKLLEIFFYIHDPTTLNAQGADKGTQYRSGIYFQTPQQQDVANALITQLSQDKLFDASIVTEVLALRHYHKAEDYHQNYFERNPDQGYCRVVINPKIHKLRIAFSKNLKIYNQ